MFSIISEIFTNSTTRIWS